MTFCLHLNPGSKKFLSSIMSEGETITQVIHFYDLDAERFAVEKNGVLEFTANKAQITEMLAQLKDFN